VCLLLKIKKLVYLMRFESIFVKMGHFLTPALYNR